MSAFAASAVVADLRDRIRQFDGRAARDRAVLPFGVPEIDDRLPGGGLALASLHEVCGGGNDAVEGAAAMLFAAGIAARTKGQVLWCLTRPDLFAPALAQAGLAPGRVIYVEAGDEKSLLLCFEEGLRHGGLGAVVAEVARLSMTASRRLQLAAEAGGTLGLALRRFRHRKEAAAFDQPTAAVTRWRVSVRPSQPLPVPGIGRARWLLELTRCRAGAAAEFDVEATDGEGRITFSSRLADRSPAALLGTAAPPADQRLVLVGRDGARRVLTAVSRVAEQAGLRVGMPLAKAHALVPDILTLPADPAADAAALNRLSLWALQHYAPIVAPDPPDGLVIDTTGADHLHGGEERMLTGLVNRLGASGIFARAAVADTWGAAHAAARFLAAPVCVIPPGETGRTVAPLPIPGLRIAPETVTGLHVLGFATIGEVLAVPRAPLVLRFGASLGRRLDQVQGTVSEPVDPLRDPEVVSARKVFGEPIGAAETIARYTSGLVGDLCRALEKRGLGARRLDLIFHRVDNTLQAIRVGTARAVRDEKRLVRLLCDRIETIDPGFGIEIMELTATLAEPLVLQQAVSSLIEEEQADIAGLVDVIANRIGARRLYRLAPVESDVPERSIHRIAPLAPDDGATWPGCWPRPARLLARPEPIEVMALLPDHPPAFFTWRGVRRRVQRADGPERIFGEWWKRDAELSAVRDYFQVEDAEGERFWLFRSGEEQQIITGVGRWFLHGIFA